MTSTDDHPPAMVDAWDDDEPEIRTSTTDAAEPAVGPLDGQLADVGQFAAVAGNPAVVQALEALEDARDALADAEGTATVAGAKADAILADAAKEEWQRLEAAEKLAKADRAVQRAQARADRAATAYLHVQYDALAAEIAASADDEEEDPDHSPELYFQTVDEFVRDFLVDHYAREVGSKQGAEALWVAHWWKSREAVSRLTALWRAWEHLRLDPGTGMSVWWRDHADHHMRMLMDGHRGPFTQLAEEETTKPPRRLAPLPYTAPPPGMFQPIDSDEPLNPAAPSLQDQSGDNTNEKGEDR